MIWCPQTDFLDFLDLTKVLQVSFGHRAVLVSAAEAKGADLWSVLLACQGLGVLPCRLILTSAPAVTVSSSMLAEFCIGPLAYVVHAMASV